MLDGLRLRYPAERFQSSVVTAGNDRSALALETGIVRHKRIRFDFCKDHFIRMHVI